VKLLGYYENFPEVAYVHGIAEFSHSLSGSVLQQTILQTFHQLNYKPHKIGEVTPLAPSESGASFEFGLAEGLAFNYLDRDEVDRALKTVNKKALDRLDFFCAIRYYTTNKGKNSRLKFDYYLLRFTFERGNADMRVFHERGPRRVSPKELLTFLIKEINVGLSRNRARPLSMKKLRAL
jgi:hypothetical protein